MPNFAAEMKSERLKEMSRFVVVGLLATALHYAIYFLLLPHVSANAAFTIGYAVSFVGNYALSSRFTFRVGASLQRFVGFGLSHAANYFVQIVLLNLFMGLGISETLAPLPVYMVAVPINYLMVRYALTRRSGKDDGYWLLLMVVAFAMLWLNLLDVPTLSDDMIYRFMWNADATAAVETIDGPADLLRSQWTHYMSTNGRFVPHLTAQALLVFMPPVVLQLADTLMFVVLLHLCTTWVCAGRDSNSADDHGSDRLLVAATACMLLFVAFSGFRTAMLWGLGAVNYLWTLVAVLALLTALRRTNVRNGSNGSKWTQALLLVLAFMAGWTHEALSLPVSIAFAAWMIAGRRVNACMIAFMTGTLLCLLSPGLWQRAGEAVSLQSRMMSGAINMVFNIRVGWLLLATLLVMWRRRPRELRSELSLHRYEYLALMMALGIVMVCGVNLERVAFFADFIAMTLLLRILVQHTTGNNRTRRMLVAGCCLVMALAYVPAYIVRAENAHDWQLAEEQMRTPGQELIALHTPQKGDSWVTDHLREHYVNSSFDFGFYCVYMAFDHTDINMRCAARLYGKQQLTFLPEDIVQRIKADSTAYNSYELDRNKELYVWRMHDDRTVKSVTFVLNDEDTSTLMPHQRLLVYQGDEYELDNFNHEVVRICGRPYLVFTKPTTNIYRRIKTIDIKY